jgi:hypothetical protein
MKERRHDRPAAAKLIYQMFAKLRAGWCYPLRHGQGDRDPRPSSSTGRTAAPPTTATDLRATPPIRRVVGPPDIAALAPHLMTNTTATGATLDIDCGQQLIPG